VSLRREESGVASRCYSGRAPGSVSTTAADGAFSMKRSISLVILSLALGLLLAACGGGGSTATLKSGDVAVVGGQTITQDDFNALIKRADISYKQHKTPIPKPGTGAYESLKGQAITFLVQRAEYAQKAQDMGIHITDKQIDDRINQLKKQFYGGSEKKYEQTLAAQGLTPSRARDEVKAQLISEALYNKVTGSVKVSDKAVTDYYNKNKALYVQKASRDVRHILVNSKALADSLYAKLVADHEKNFAALAKKYSKDPGSAANGGRLTITKGQTVPQFDKVAFSLKTGAIAKPIKTSYGWHIIQALSAIRPPSTTSLSKVKEQIRLQLEQQQKNTVMTNWVNDVKKEFCKPGKVKYESGFAPTTDPCASLTSATTTT
jgi:foldase protein PrsA